MVLSKEKIDWAKARNSPHKSVCGECGCEKFERDNRGKWYCAKCGCARSFRSHKREETTNESE